MENYKIFSGNTYPEEEKEVKRFFRKICWKTVKDCAVLLAGGAIRSIFMKETPSDYDLFFPSQTNLFKCQDHLSQFVTCNKAAISFETSNAVTFKLNNLEPPIQIISKMYGDPVQVMKTFDIIVCKAGYFPLTQQWIIHEDFFEDLKEKRIRFVENLTAPYSAMRRAFKYQEKGFHISNKEIGNLAIQCNKTRRQTDIEILRQVFSTYNPLQFPTEPSPLNDNRLVFEYDIYPL